MVTAEPSTPPSTEPSPEAASTSTDTTEDTEPAPVSSGPDAAAVPAPISAPPPAPGREDQDSPDAPAPSPASGWVLLVRSPGENERDGQVDRIPTTSSDSGGAARPEPLAPGPRTPEATSTSTTGADQEPGPDAEREGSTEPDMQDRSEKDAAALTADRSRAPSAPPQPASSPSSAPAHDASLEASATTSQEQDQGHGGARERAPLEPGAPVSHSGGEHAVPVAQRGDDQDPCAPGQQAAPTGASAPGDQAGRPEAQHSAETTPGRSEFDEQIAPAEPRTTELDVTSANAERKSGPDKHPPAAEAADGVTSGNGAHQDHGRSGGSEKARSAEQGSERDEGGDGAQSQPDPVTRVTSWQHSDDSPEGHDEARQGEHRGEPSQERPPAAHDDEERRALDPDQRGDPAPSTGQDTSPAALSEERDPSQPEEQDHSPDAHEAWAGAASTPQGDGAVNGSEGQGADRWRTTVTLADGEASGPTVS